MAPPAVASTRTRLFRPAVLLLPVLLCAANLASAQQATTFEGLSEVLKVGDRIRITDTSGRTTDGRLLGLTSVELSVRVDGQPTTFQKGVVEKVARVSPLGKEVAKDTAVFAAIGAGLAILLSHGLGGDGVSAEDVLVGAGSLAAVGAGLSLALNTALPRSKVVFVASTHGQGSFGLQLTYRVRW